MTSLFHPSGLSPNTLSSVRPWQTSPSKLGTLPLLPFLAHCLLQGLIRLVIIYQSSLISPTGIEGLRPSTQHSAKHLRVLHENTVKWMEGRAEDRIWVGKNVQGHSRKGGPTSVWGVVSGAGEGREPGLTSEAVPNTPSPSPALPQPISTKAYTTLLHTRPAPSPARVSGMKKVPGSVSCTRWLPRGQPPPPNLSKGQKGTQTAVGVSWGLSTVAIATWQRATLCPQEAF